MNKIVKFVELCCNFLEKYAKPCFCEKKSVINDKNVQKNPNFALAIVGNKW